MAVTQVDIWDFFFFFNRQMSIMKTRRVYISVHVMRLIQPCDKDKGLLVRWLNVQMVSPTSCKLKVLPRTTEEKKTVNISHHVHVA